MRERDAGRRGRWRAAPAEHVVWTSWDDDYVAYHRPSGKTHFLNASSHYLLTELLREPRDVQAVADAFGDSSLAEVAAMLEHFEHLGLIEDAWEP